MNSALDPAFIGISQEALPLASPLKTSCNHLSSSCNWHQASCMFCLLFEILLFKFLPPCLQNVSDLGGLKITTHPWFVQTGLEGIPEALSAVVNEL